MRSRLLLADAALAGLALAGCTVGPNYRPPELATPPAYVEPQTAVPTGNDVDPARWWTAFRDPVLERLVERALVSAPDIQIAASRVREARYGEIIAGAVGKPTITALGGYSRIAPGSNVSIGGGSGNGTGSASGTGASGTNSLSDITISAFNAGFDSAWELELFGGDRRQRQAASAQAEAMVWNRRDAAVTLAGEIAQTYFALRQDQTLVATVLDELARQRRALEIAGNQARVGLTPQVDVTRQRATITSTEARLEPLRSDAQLRIHALGVLLGESPEALTGELSAPAVAHDAVPVVPAGLPSDLLRRRPDVRAAERQLAAATAEIGVATADLYPKLSLTGITTLASSALSSLFTGNSLTTVGLANATFPIIDWGRRRATVGQRREQREQQYLTYKQTVLRALRDVEDALAQIDAERRRHETLVAAVNDAASTARSLEARYRTGLSPQTDLLNAEAQVLSAREQVVSSEAQQRQMTAALFKAIGGGWETLPDVPGTDKEPTQPLR